MNLVILAVLLTAQPQLEILPAEISALQPVTITGPITGTPSFLNWTPSPVEQPEIPLPTLDVSLWLGIAWYWIKTTWLDGQIFDYWIIYQIAVSVLGNVIGMFLSKGSFGRLVERNLAGTGTPDIRAMDRQHDVLHSESPAEWRRIVEDELREQARGNQSSLPMEGSSDE